MEPQKCPKDNVLPENTLTFEEFKIKFNKSYANPEEEKMRREIFLATQGRLISQNQRHSQGEDQMALEITHMADYTAKEMAELTTGYIKQQNKS